MREKIDKLVEISRRISNGKKRADFCIIADHGMGYKTTGLEYEYREAVNSILKLIKEDEHFISNYLLKNLAVVFDNVYHAYDSFRERTPACGGDYTDIDSPVKSETEWLKYELHSALSRLKDQNPEYYNSLDKLLSDI
jgi:hypothetical protein